MKARICEQSLGPPLSALAKAKVLTDLNARCAEPADEHFVDELLCAVLCELLVETDHDDLLNAERLNQLGLSLR